jgi:UDP-glucose 6-dehydrogenase
MKVCVIGNGVTGKANVAWFKKVMATPENIIDGLLIHDPPQGLDESDNVKLCDYVFICVPAPAYDDNSQNLKAIRKSIELCSDSAKIFVRSTVLPSTCDFLSKEFKKEIYSMPEFLTERTSYLCMSRLDILCGCAEVYLKGNITTDTMDVLYKLFPNKKIKFVSNTEAELAKFMHNALGATKVTFANVFSNLCKEYGADYDVVKSSMNITGYFSPMHLNIAVDGKAGYGGKCFPENMALLQSIVDSDLLNGVVGDNKKFRGE